MVNEPIKGTLVAARRTVNRASGTEPFFPGVTESADKPCAGQMAQLRDLLPDPHMISALEQARFAAFAGLQSTASRNRGDRVSR